LNIEMAALKMLGDWLKGSGWVQALVQADITTRVQLTLICKQCILLNTR